MGPEGKPSPTIVILEHIKLLDEHGFRPVTARTNLDVPIALESIPTGFPSSVQDHVDKSIALNR